MPATNQMLRQKTNELETALDEVQEELARAGATRETAAHTKLTDTIRDARSWLEEHGDASADGEEAARQTRKIEDFLHAVRMHRTEI